MYNPVVSTEALQALSAAEAGHWRLLPYKLDGGTLYCLGAEGMDYTDAGQDIPAIYGFHLSVERIAQEELERLLTMHYRTGASFRPEGREGTPLPEGPDFLDALIREAVGMGASDIHLEPLEDRCRVRLRIDGRLLERHVIPRSDYPSVVNRIKILSDLDISEKRLPQDGRIAWSAGGEKLDIRTSVMPTIHGEKAVLRLLIGAGRRRSLEELGFDACQLEDYSRAASSPHGMILISGPTGSGKTTTLYATLEMLNRGDNNILTIEDPVEYTLDGINQVQLKEEIGLDFTAALRTFLRQDPDIIMLGEIRDAPTAQMAVRSSLTGHLVLSTLHTNSAWGCTTRLMDMGIHPYLLGETLVACVAQRLVRLLCPHCRREDSWQGRRVFIPVGCPECWYTGYRGRKAVYEVIPLDAELSRAVRERQADISGLLAARGIRTLREAALDLLERGETSPEEVIPLMNETV